MPAPDKDLTFLSVVVLGGDRSALFGVTSSGALMFGHIHPHNAMAGANLTASPPNTFRVRWYPVANVVSTTDTMDESL